MTPRSYARCLAWHFTWAERRSWPTPVKELEEMGLKQKVQTLVYRQRGQFMVHGIQQVPGTNHYVFVIEKTTEKGNGIETISLDITTGKTFSDDSGKKAAPKRSANGSQPNQAMQPTA